MTDKLETVFIYVMAAIDLIKRAYLRFFPTAAVMFTFLYVIGLAGSSDRGLLTKDSAGQTITVALIFTIFALLYIIVELKEGRHK